MSKSTVDVDFFLHAGWMSRRGGAVGNRTRWLLCEDDDAEDVERNTDRLRCGVFHIVKPLVPRWYGYVHPDI